ncbi:MULTISPECIES: serine protease [unclassified Pseudomonas]|uniref:S1 family peptidase n=1 Tax=unclassified Pseudomonas TaxID=196821 RepID=UPI002096E4EE|nr:MULTISPECIES: serine protease [unclassified Pseudomonas]MCO7518567.1 serine protease [Pseudomonas sp. 1]MCO7539643.1 serine protease [Pseudomonas sp. VA159-2]
MHVTPYLSSTLGALLSVATLCMVAFGCEASAPPGSGINLSGMAMYERTTKNFAPNFALRQVAQSTAFLIDSGNDAAPALLVGSGHALEDSADIVDAELPGTGHISFASVAGRHFSVARVRYVSRRGLDFAIFELSQTQGALKALGVTPLALAGRKAVEDEPVIAVPRLSDSHRGIASWPEQDLPWIDMKTGDGVVYRHLLRVEGASLQPGDSGSPVLDATHRVLAIFHSTLPGAGHASDLSFLPACLIQGRFNAQGEGCGLDNVFNVLVEKDDDSRLIYKQSVQAPIVIDSPVYSTTPFYQAKLAQWPEQCEQADGYGVQQVSGDVLNLPVTGLILAPANPTVLALCLWGREADGPEPANRNAVALPVVVHPPGPAAQPEMDVSAPYLDAFGRWAYRINVPSRHILFQRVEFKLGPWQSTACADPRGYGDLSSKIIVRQDSRLCAVGIDYAGQRSVAVEVRLRPRT